jgi:hypothetical protein
LLLFLVHKEKLSWLGTLKYFIYFLRPSLVYKHLQQGKQSIPHHSKAKAKAKEKEKQRKAKQRKQG